MATTDETEINRNALRAFLSAPPGDPDAIERYIAPDFELPDDMHNGLTGLEAVKARYEMLNSAITINIAIEDMVAEDDKVAARLHITGRQIGDFLGVISRGKEFAIDEILIAQFRDGKMIRNWRVVDTLKMIQQLQAE